MARGRHVKPSGLLSRLFPGREGRRRTELQQDRALVRQLRDEMLRLRGVGAALAADAAMAAARARRAEEQAVAARADVADLRAETGALRDELARLREEVLWAWAGGRPSIAAAAPARVIDLREASAG
jgi:hypothetical protein